MKHPSHPTGVLLVNLGTPDAPDEASVRRYLREFLGDPKVLSMPAPVRLALLHGFILRTRPKLTAAAYQKIWTDEGSPLAVESRRLVTSLARTLGGDYAVELAMRYGNPSLKHGLARLRERNAEGLLLVPLFPQYAEATSGSIKARLGELLSESEALRMLTLPAFFDRPGWIEAVARAAQPVLAEAPVDHVVMSFHGLPEKHIRKSDRSGSHCLANADCCNRMSLVNRDCYRAQASANAHAIASRLELADDAWTLAFQSRFGRSPWIGPALDEVLPDLAARGVRRLAVLCPSFVCDGLETLEEIGIRARARWGELGGEHFRLAPCPNAAPYWVDSLAEMIRACATPEASAAATDTPER
ncbi:MAG: ferrochelatase [Myxococcota bacterium]